MRGDPDDVRRTVRDDAPGRAPARQDDAGRREAEETRQLVVGPLQFALLGALVPAALRLAILPRGGAPPVVLAGHALLVETGLGLALALLALGTGSTVPGGVAYGAIWAVRLGGAVTFHGAVVPVFETAAAWASALAVALVLARPLAPFREEVFG